MLINIKRKLIDDLMPTMPGRAIGGGRGGAGAASLNDLDNNRGGNIRAPEATNVDHARNNPIRLSNNARQNYSGADTNGNFRNKNPQNVMPKAG